MPSYNYKTDELPLSELPLFYLNIVQHWEEIRHITVFKDTPAFNEVIIWNNSDIKVDGKNSLLPILALQGCYQTG